MRHFNEYQLSVMALRLDSAKDPMYPVLSLAGEAGELCGMIGKAIRDGEKPDHKKAILKELGDVLWNITAIAEDNGFSLQDVADANVAKLYDRAKRGVLQGSGDNR